MLSRFVSVISSVGCCLSLGWLLASEPQAIDTSGFQDVIKHWNDKYGRDRQDAWYAPHQIQEIADNLVLYQVEDGGWAKSLNPLVNVPEAELRTLLGRSLNQSTLDNRTTYPHIAYLAKVYVATGEVRYKSAAERGLDYIFREQRTTGGWRGADVDAVTYNDDVMLGVMRLLREIEQQPAHFAWLDDARKANASLALKRAMDLTLKCQIVVEGIKTGWCQQHSHATFAPVKARAYELPSICPAESSGIVQFLMEIDEPSSPVIEAIEAAVAWFERSKIMGIQIQDVQIEPVRFENHTTTLDRIVVKNPDAPPLWTRYYEIETNRPFFCNRDGIKVYSLAEVQLERRSGYGWYSSAPRRVLETDYPAWKARLQANLR